MPRNFSFIIPGQLAGSGMPGRDGRLSDDLEKLRDQQITAIISLTEGSLEQAALQAAGLSYLHIPIVDYRPPTLEQIRSMIRFSEQVIQAGGAVLVHCMIGIGRTGTMLAAFLVHRGLTAQEAIQKVRAQRPGSIETALQIRAVHDFEAAQKHHLHCD